MQLINRIHSSEELKSFRNQVGRVLENRLGSKLKQRKLDELTADLLGVHDFNTALGMAKMASSVPKGVETEQNIEAKALCVQAWHSVLQGMVEDGYVEEDDLQELLDESVYDFVGSTKWHSDHINNQGWENQLWALGDNQVLPNLRTDVSNLTGILTKDIQRCLNEAEANLKNNEFNAEKPFPVKEHIGY